MLLCTWEWEKVKEDQELQPTRMPVTCADRWLIEVWGPAEFKIDFGNCSRNARMVVSDIGHGGILGMDALRKSDVSVDVGQGRIILEPPETCSDGPCHVFLEEQEHPVAEVSVAPLALSDLGGLDLEGRKGESDRTVEGRCACWEVGSVTFGGGPDSGGVDPVDTG